MRTLQTAVLATGGRPPWHPPMLLAREAILPAALVVACLVLAGCGSEGAGAPLGTARSSSPAPAPSASASPAGASVFGRVLSNPAVTATGGKLYVAWQLSPPGGPTPRFELAQADQATGAIRASRRLAAGQPGAPLAAGGWLWLTNSTATGERLLRLNPADLAVTGNISISGSSYRGFTGGAPDLAVAGGALWVTSGSRLLRVSLRTGRILAVIELPGAVSSGVGASADGTVLVVSQANDSGIGTVQRRDPVTGTLLASHPMMGVIAPRIGAVMGTGVWLAEPTGMMGYIQRFSLATMAPDPATQVTGTNGITVRGADGLIWVTQQNSASGNYCADPVTGRVIARIPLPDPGQDYVSAIAGGYVYYLAPARAGLSLNRLGVPASCGTLSRRACRSG